MPFQMLASRIKIICPDRKRVNNLDDLMNKKTQQEKILSYIKEHGKLNSFYATYGLSIKQAPTRIRELKQLGYDIVSVPNGDKSVDYVLRGSGFISAPQSPSLQDGHFCGDTFRQHLATSCKYCQPVQEALI